MRVMHLVTRSQRRGAEKVALELRAELERLGHDNEVVALARGLDGSEDPELPPLVPRPGVGRAATARHLWRLTREVRRYQPSVILAHGGEAVKLATLLPRRHRPPVVWQRILGLPPGGLSPMRRLLWHFVASRVAAGIAISPELAEELRALGVRGEVLEVPNTRRAADFERLDHRSCSAALRRELGVDDDTPLVGFVGHLVPQKRPERALEVARSLLDRGVEAHLVVAGDGPLRPLLEDEVTRLGIGDRVSLLGHRADVPRLLAGLDLVVLTSDSEGVAGVVVEAQMAGCPVVAFEGLGAHLGMTPGRSGLLVRHGDVSSMAAAVASLLAHRARLAEMGTEARRSSARFATEVVVHEYEQLLRRVAAPGRPRVLYLLPSFGVGGAERALLVIARTGDRSRFTPLAAALRAPTHAVDATVIPALADAGLPVHDLGAARRADRSLVGLAVAAWRLRRYCRAAGVDIVDSSLFEADLVARVALLGTGIRHVVHLVNTPYDPLAARHGHHRGRWRLRAVQRVDAATARLTDSFVAITAAVADAARRDLGVDGDRVVVIERGIQLDEFPALPAPPAGGADVLRLLTVGRLSPQKGHAVAIRAVARARAAGVDVRLTIVGEGELEAELAATAEALGVQGAGRLLGRRSDVSELHGQHDAFCFPSLWEGQGNALLEAMASERPAVVTDLPVFREVLGDAGLFVPPGDEVALAGAMVDLARLGPERRRDLGRRARERAEQRYDAPSRVHDLVSHYVGLTA